MTGFRLHLRGAQGLYGVTPDLTTLGQGDRRRHAGRRVRRPARHHGKDRAARTGLSGRNACPAIRSRWRRDSRRSRAMEATRGSTSALAERTRALTDGLTGAANAQPGVAVLGAIHRRHVRHLFREIRSRFLRGRDDVATRSASTVSFIRCWMPASIWRRRRSRRDLSRRRIPPPTSTRPFGLPRTHFASSRSFLIHRHAAFSRGNALTMTTIPA